MATLLEQWREAAYAQDQNTKESKKFWKDYFAKEKEIYRQLLSQPDAPVKGSVKALAAQFDIDVMTMTGFLDGINDSLKKENNIEKMTEKTMVSLDYDPEKLYWHMVEAKADWLYELPEWDALLSEEKRRELYMDQKHSGTVRKEAKVGRNDPCPCGSGLKYKKCCGKDK